jgi:hypothetical protein
MFIKKLDLLSPKITLYYKDYDSHASMISGILNIISFFILLSFSGYFISSLIKKEEPKTIFFNNYKEDIGIYEVNSSSFFHFLSIEEKGRKFINKGFDFSKFKIIGFNTYFESYLYSKYRLHFDHWIYGKCKNENYTKEIKDKDLDNYEFFGDSACISKYYNHNDKKYFNFGETGFKWPEIAHGKNNKNNKFYNIIIGKCDEDILKLILGEDEDYKCENESTIKNFIESETPRTFNLYFKDNYINILDYNNPISNYFNLIENLMNFDKYSIDNLNFIHSTVQTDVGIFYDNLIENISYSFDRNEEQLKDRKNFDAFLGYRFLMNNLGFFYEREYKKIQDCISNLGGVYNAVNIVFFMINLIINKYITISDTQLLLNTSVNIKPNFGKISNRNSVSKNFDQKLTSDFSYNKIDNFRNKFIDKIEDKKGIYNTQEITSKGNTFITSKEDTKDKNIVEDLNQYSNINISFDKTKLRTNKTKEINEKYFKFISYIFYKYTCGKKYEFYSIYENFRMKILNEENLMRQNLNINNILKIIENQTLTKGGLNYQFKDSSDIL